MDLVSVRKNWANFFLLFHRVETWSICPSADEIRKDVEWGSLFSKMQSWVVAPTAPTSANIPMLKSTQYEPLFFQASQVLLPVAILSRVTPASLVIEQKAQNTWVRRQSPQLCTPRSPFVGHLSVTVKLY